MQKIKFINKNQATFFAALRTRVDEYFQKNNLSKSGGNTLLVKAIIMLSLYFVPYFLILFGNFSTLINAALLILMGIGIAGVGMSVMHDAIHGTFSDKKWLNKVLGGSIYFLGGNAYNWEMQHNTLHHTYTNILEMDEDITGKFMLRLNVAAKRKFFHRFQHIYAFFLYSLMTISFLWKDFKEIAYFNKLSKSGIMKPYSNKELAILLLTKALYIVFILVIPMLLMPITIGQWAIGFLIMHCTSGLILSTVFQLAHVVEGAIQPIPDENGCVDNAWAVHQLRTTSNFFGKNKLFSWYIGGLDFQIEHHLFPKISHIYYRDLSKIVEQTSKEFGLYYNSKGGFFQALGSHINMLRTLGVS
ncbi:acyl-CoA desaturase [Lacihabitans sp. LS3-19]|uniref:fatty acid desaturase family protein n=1 Tax=Lacihabitans sp. LS3-19 TaxID=2487335 RepID=UPI0020CC18A2|nr:acyl-CoA desaturase [Lacihabitans sp. LS3-19]MCP9770143.1 acyl-CoA desaturase [Lacihabitans sp. LS3-19]